MAPRGALLAWAALLSQGPHGSAAPSVRGRAAALYEGVSFLGRTTHVRRDRGRWERWGETAGRVAWAGQVICRAGPVTTESGLSYSDTHIGRGRKAREGDKVRVAFSIAGEDRKVIIDSRQGDKGFEPAIFFIGDGSVIPGLDEGVRGMAEEGKRTLRIPPNLAFMNERNISSPLPSTTSLVDETKPVFMALELISIGNPFLRMQIAQRKPEVFEENARFNEEANKKNEHLSDPYQRSGFFLDERKNAPLRRRKAKDAARTRRSGPQQQDDDVDAGPDGDDHDQNDHDGKQGGEG